MATWWIPEGNRGRRTRPRKGEGAMRESARGGRKRRRRRWWRWRRKREREKEEEEEERTRGPTTETAEATGWAGRLQQRVTRYRGDEQVRASPRIRLGRRALTCDRRRVYHLGASVRRHLRVSARTSRSTTWRFGELFFFFFFEGTFLKGSVYQRGWLSNGGFFVLLGC